MTTKQYLEQLEDIDTIILTSCAEEVRWLDIATNISSSNYGEKVKTSPRPDRMESAIVKAVDCSKRAGVRASEFMAIKETIERQLRELGDSLCFKLLWWKYHEGKGYTELSEILGYSYSQTKRLHKKALVMFETKYGNEYLSKKIHYEQF